MELPQAGWNADPQPLSQAQTSSPTSYIGRFAPTPSGPLHFGSLVCALAGWLQARSLNGQWRLRVDDLDLPRVVPGAGDEILRQLEAFGLEWDGPVIYQHRRIPQYRAVLERLRRAGFAYACHCSRKEVDEAAHTGLEGPIYPRTCHFEPDPNRPFRLWRCLTDGAVDWVDRLLGEQQIQLEQALGDFPLWRAEDIPSYHLATVVDEELDQITEVVRGQDLLFSSARHIYLAGRLAYQPPQYLHLPLVKNKEGEKISKQTKAPPLEQAQAPYLLVQALRFLGQQPPRGLGGVVEVLSWAREHWDLAQVPRQT